MINKKEINQIDELVYSNILQSCIHVGDGETAKTILSQEVKSVSESSTRSGDIASSSTGSKTIPISHYNCVVDALGRGGNIQESYDFICENMKEKEKVDVSTWKILLTNCKNHGVGNEVKEIALKELEKLSEEEEEEDE